MADQDIARGFLLAMIDPFGKECMVNLIEKTCKIFFQDDDKKCYKVSPGDIGTCIVQYEIKYSGIDRKHCIAETGDSPNPCIIRKSKILKPYVFFVRDVKFGSFQELLLIQIKFGKIHFYTNLNQLAT